MLAFGFADENVAGFVCPGGTRARGAGTPSSSPGPTPSGPPRGCRSSSFWSFWSTSSRVVVFEILSESVSLSSPKRVFFRCKRSYTIGFFLCAHNDTHTRTHTHTHTHDDDDSEKADKKTKEDKNVDRRKPPPPPPLIVVYGHAISMVASCTDLSKKSLEKRDFYYYYY